MDVSYSNSRMPRSSAAKAVDKSFLCRSFYLTAFYCASLILLTLSSLVPSANAQSVSPTNTFSPDPSISGLQLSVYNVGPRYNLQHLARDASARAIDNISVSGKLVRTVAAIDSSAVIFISCDQPNPSGANAIDTIRSSILRGPSAVVLYSDVVAGCNYTTGPSIPSSYFNLFTMTQSTGNGSLFEFAERHGNQVIIQRRNLFDSNSTSPSVGNTGGPGGPSPSTAVAMIILYSITGVITALFLIIIVTGAIRAHRHPERYGPRTAHGRPRQSRARGIARAMLDTIPIVKFGEREEDKVPDVEMSGTQPQAAVKSTDDAHSSVQQKEASLADTEPDAVVGATNGEASTTHETNVPPTVPTPPAGENQGCSICTDDFEIGQDVRVLPCSHSFHPACIDPWLLNVSGTCPLCRIDLRPKTAQRQDTASSADPSVPTEREEDMFPPPLDPTVDARRASRRHSLLWDILNPSRMRDATPQERIAALRQVREERGNTPSEEAEARRRRRLTARLQDVFSIRTSPRDTQATPTEPTVREEPRAPTSAQPPQTTNTSSSQQPSNVQ